METIAEGVVISGRYYDREDPVGSFILHHNRECVVIETPPDRRWFQKTQDVLEELGNPRVLFVSETHDHEDHFNIKSAPKLMPAGTLPELEPLTYWEGSIGGEPLWVIRLQKHSPTDKVFVFRGVALTGDIELGQIESVNDEVPDSEKFHSLQHLADFEQVCGYRINTLVSSHLNDWRSVSDWRAVVLPT